MVQFVLESFAVEVAKVAKDLAERYDDGITRPGLREMGILAGET